MSSGCPESCDQSCRNCLRKQGSEEGVKGEGVEVEGDGVVNFVSFLE